MGLARHPFGPGAPEADRSEVAAAQINRWRAAEAAAKANQAAAEANQAAGEAQKSAEAAAGYAASAKKSAEAAEASSARARQSAATARNAAAAAGRDADDAEASAARVQFSADYARQSAGKADATATQARASALAAGKSKDEAATFAAEAWADVKTKREAEIAAAQRQAEETRKKQAEADKKKPKCFVPYDRDSVPPCLLGADADQVVFTAPDWELAKLVGLAVWEISGGADIERCIKEPSWGGCIMAAAGVLPIGKLKLLDKAVDGVEALAKASRVGKNIPCLTPKHSFLAGTRVLMGDRTTRPIEEIAAGDQVLATDPESGVTGPRRVDATIYTPDDRDFTDLTVGEGDDTGALTTTGHHPFWSQNEKKWKNAADLTTQDTLRTPEGGTAQIAQIRHWTGLAPAYNLTVNDLHTYYVLAGDTAVLVHNQDEISCSPLDIGQQIGDYIEANIPKKSGQMNHISETVSGLGMGQRNAALTVHAASERAFGKAQPPFFDDLLPNGNVVVLPTSITVKAWFEVTPGGEVLARRGSWMPPINGKWDLRPDGP
ncbi:polymorphic toxin-type HINT domain-containing protein [Streptomyces sp. NPDC093801]|uniref:polymorphic toxin-type HINT domain-containing protein n=1 Tax=Streptomyces sp. NPDC093801 TaxID=3155203 RepID=UPI00344BED2C